MSILNGNVGTQRTPHVGKVLSAIMFAPVFQIEVAEIPLAI
jgi:hypothetical protein